MSGEALVTGSAGHLGSHVVRRLLDAGWQVRGFDLRQHPADLLTRSTFEERRGDVRERDPVVEAAIGCQLLVHSAMRYEPEGPGEDLGELALVGLENAALAARHAAARLIHVSSTAALGECDPGEHPGGLDESAWNEAPGSEYARAKVAAGRRLVELLEEEPSLDALAVLPSMVIGPADPTGTASNRRIRAMARQARLPLWFEGGLAVVDVRDVAEGILQAAGSGRRGARYLLSAYNLTMRELFTALRRTRRIPGEPRLRVPGAPLVAAVGALEQIFELAGRRPFVRAGQVRHRLERVAWFDSGRARRELGWTPRPLDQTLEAVLDGGSRSGGRATRLRVGGRLEGSRSGGRATRLRVGGRLALASVGRRTPLFVGWSLTDRCNRSCAYCGRWDRGSPELPEARVMEAAAEIAEAGVTRVNLTGGEPLLHPRCLDVARLLTRLGVAVKVTSNGALLPRALEQAGGAIASATVSIDGGREAHDRVRGAGSWDAAVAGARAVKNAGLRLSLHAVITRHTIDQAQVVLDLAGELGCLVGFTMLREVPAMGRRDLESLAPTPEQWRGFVDDLVARKRGGDGRIQNSLAGLAYLRRWPVHHPIRCCAGVVYARIEPDGRVFGCGNLVRRPGAPSLAEMDFGRAWETLVLEDCRECWCDTRVEMNMVLSARPSALAAASHR